MNKYFSNTIKSLAISVVLASVVTASPKYVQISDIKQTESDKIIVYEFFWYGCPHCFNIEPTMNAIESNLEKALQCRAATSRTTKEPMCR